MSAPKQQAKSTTESANHSVVAVVHQVGSSWRCLFANPHDSTNDQQQPDLLGDKIVSTEEELEALLKEESPSQIYAILPGSLTVCRTTTLPDVGEDQIFEALRLQAEAKLLGQTSVHRRAFAALEPAIGETNRVGLIVAWPENSAHSLPRCLDDARFIPDVASIAALLGGLRPNDPTVVADPSDGTVTISISHANGTALRATREDCATNDSFHKGIVRVARETASLHNHTDSFTDNLAEQLSSALEQQRDAELLFILPPAITESLSNRVSNTPNNDATWWATWGIAVGGLLALTGSLQTLTTMRLDAEVVHPTVTQRLTERLESRTFAIKLATVALLLLAIGPALFAGIRLTMLEMMNPTIATQYASLVESRKQQIVYKELGKTAWPMTKVIADVTNNVPIGIEIDSIRIDIGQPISLRGRAIKADGKTAAELIASMQTNLQKTGVFKDITFAYDPAGTYGDREFDLWATVSDPLRRPRYSLEEDFGKWTLAMRQAGISPEDEVIEIASPDTAPSEENASPLSMANADDIPENTDPIATFGDHEDRVVESRPRPIGGSNGATSHSGNRGDDGPTLRAPDPISPEQIKLMNRSEVMMAVKDIAEAKKRVGRSNPELKERLQKEFRLLMDHLKELPSG